MAKRPVIVIDWIRLVLFCECVTAVVLYGWSSTLMGRAMWLNRTGPYDFTWTITFGRFLRCLCILLLAGAGCEGNLEQWGNPYTFRVALALAGYSLALLSWWHVERLVNVRRSFEAENEIRADLEYR